MPLGLNLRTANLNHSQFGSLAVAGPEGLASVLSNLEEPGPQARA